MSASKIIEGKKELDRGVDPTENINTDEDGGKKAPATRTRRETPILSTIKEVLKRSNCRNARA